MNTTDKIIEILENNLRYHLEKDSCGEWIENMFNKIAYEIEHIVPSERLFDIECGMHIKMQVTINNNIPKIEKAVDGWGRSMQSTDFIITELPQPPKMKGE